MSNLHGSSSSTGGLSGRAPSGPLPPCCRLPGQSYWQYPEGGQGKGFRATAGLMGVSFVPLTLQWPELSHMTQARGLAPLPVGQPFPSLCSHWTGSRSCWVLVWPLPFAKCCHRFCSASPQPVLPAFTSFTGDSIALEQLGHMMRENRLTPVAVPAPV